MGGGVDLSAFNILWSRWPYWMPLPTSRETSPQQATQSRRKRTQGTSNDRSPNRGKILTPNFTKGERRRWGNPRGAVTRRIRARVPRQRFMSFLSAD
jgi:hypothetical protein